MIRITNATGSNTQWVILEGSIAGFPHLTRRHTIHAGALAEGHTTIQQEMEKLKATMQEHHKRWLAVAAAVKEIPA